MNITYVSIFDALDIHGWSGSGFYIANALKAEGNNIEYVSSLSRRLTRATRLELKMKKYFYKTIGKAFIETRSVQAARQYAKMIQAETNPHTDLLFGVGSLPLSMCSFEKPMVFYADATFAGVTDFYKEYSNLSWKAKKEGDYLQQRMLDNCSLAIYTSDWAAQSAIEYYGAPPHKIRVVPFGANIDTQREFDDVQQLIESRSQSECHLLFLGVDWERKGGNIALETVKILNEKGVKAFLHIAGIKQLPYDRLPDYVINHGFISKSTHEGRAYFDKLFSSCHFLLLPTRAEAFGLVFCEANSFGVPSVATNVGGIPTIIKDNVNGKMFSLESSAYEYASYIQAVHLDRQQYQQLAYSSFGEYQTRLNWNVSGKKIMDILTSIK